MDGVFVSLAPFQGITTILFRNIFTTHFPGYDAVYSPFISGVNPEKVNPSKFNDVIPQRVNSIRTIPQFASTNPDEIIAIGKFLFDNGFDEMNWNMGCPFARIANKKRGCGILPYPDLVLEIMDKVMAKIEIGLSVKCRLGYKLPDELLDVAPIFNQYPLREIIVHPRIGTQLYRGEINISKFAEFLTINRHKLAYNGDIYHLGKYIQLRAAFPAINHWMVGRGALINPFLASQIKGLSLDDSSKREKIFAFHKEFFDQLNKGGRSQKAIFGTLKSIWYYQCGMFVNGEKYFAKLKSCEDSKTYILAVDEIIAQPFADDKTLEVYFKNILKHI